MPVQRWRLTVARGPDAPDLSQRDQQAAWSAALLASGLAHGGEPEPARLAHAAPIPNGLTADAEILDLFLPVRRTAADVRERIGAAMPEGYRLVGLHDVWLGEPALPAVLEAADYRVRVTADGEPPDAVALRDAVARLLAAVHLDRAGRRAGNLRPLVDDVRVGPDGALWMRLRFDPALGTGRPEEVVAALASFSGQPLIAATRHRERLWLRGEDRGDGRDPSHRS